MADLTGQVNFHDHCGINCDIISNFPPCELRQIGKGKDSRPLPAVADTVADPGVKVVVCHYAIVAT